MNAIGSAYSNAMHRLYQLCIGIGIVSVIFMTGLIFTGVIMRYVFDMGARFAEPMSIFFIVQLTMYGAAACFRVHVHLRLRVFVQMLPERLQHWVDQGVNVLLAGVAVFMIVYGASLTQTTWFQAYPEFDYVKVGLVYSAIPGSGLVLLLFVIEAAFVRRVEVQDEDEDLEAVLEESGDGSSDLVFKRTTRDET